MSHKTSVFRHTGPDPPDRGVSSRHTARRRSPAPPALLERRQHEVLVGLLPHQPDRFARTGEVRHHRLALGPLQKLDSQRRHRERRPPELFPIGQGDDRTRPVAQQVPVEQQPKAVVPVATHRGGIRPGGAVGGHHTWAAVDLQFHHVGVTHPARYQADAALEGRRPRVL